MQGDRDSAVRCLTKAMDLLNLLGRRRREMGVTELALELGMTKSAVHRLLQTLESAGFAERNPATRKYFLGSRLFVLGKVYESSVSLRGLARPVLERLARQTGEAVHLAIPNRAGTGVPSMILLDKMESEYRLTITPYPGAVSPAYCTGTGKVLLAYVMEAELDGLKEPLTGYTERTITDLEQLHAELTRIRAQGYAEDREELEIGLTCVAAPVFEQGEVVASLSVSGPTTRLTPERFPSVRQSVVSAAQELSALLR